MELTKKSDFVIPTERSEWRNLLYRYVERCLDSRWSLDMTVNRHFLVSPVAYVYLYIGIKSPRTHLMQKPAQPDYHRNRLSWRGQAHCNGNASTERQGTWL